MTTLRTHNGRAMQQGLNQKDITVIYKGLHALFSTIPTTSTTPEHRALRAELRRVRKKLSNLASIMRLQNSKQSRTRCIEF